MAKKKNIKDKTIEGLREICGYYKNKIDVILTSDEFREMYSDMNYKEKEFCQVILEGIIDGKANSDIKNDIKRRVSEPGKTIVDIAAIEDRAKEVLFGARYYVDDEDEQEETMANKDNKKNKPVEEKESDVKEMVKALMNGVEMEDDEDTSIRIEKPEVKEKTEKPKKVIEVEPELKNEDKVEVVYLSDIEKEFGSKKEKVVHEIKVDEKSEEPVKVLDKESTKQDDTRFDSVVLEVLKMLNKGADPDPKVHRTLVQFDGPYRAHPTIPLSEDEQMELWVLMHFRPWKYSEIIEIKTKASA